MIPKIRTALFDKLTLLLLVGSIYLSPLIEARFNLSYFREVTFACFWLMWLFTFIFFNKKQLIDIGILVYTALASGLLVISAPFWLSYATVNSYLGVITACLVFTLDFNFFCKLLKVIVHINTLIITSEYVFQEYLFVSIIEVEGEAVELSKKLFGGAIGIFRAKGLFEGPLTLGQFCIGTSLLFYKDTRILVFNLLACILANSRLGILCISSILIVKWVFSLNIESIWKISTQKIFYLAIGLISLIVVFIKLDFQSVHRILSMFNSEHSTNSARFHFWTLGLKEYLSYEPINLLLGKAGYFRSMAKNSSENSFLFLLLENGLLGFLYYVFPLLFLSVIASFKHVFFLLLFGILTFCLFIQTYYLGASANLLLWLFLFKTYVEFRGKLR
ncbi:hypothetical protein AAG747_29015 [Rapidithrix thailandica]|uniref:O-antigen polymerase n=1 Tax=Rapidithrix thailandica TaxID=413964 RepID=A0AAW9SMJ6_9BACT